MANEPIKAKEGGSNRTDKNDNSVMMLVIAAAILTLVAAGGGWFLGAKIGKDIVPTPHNLGIEDITISNDVNNKSGEATTVNANTNLVSLQPILTNLAAPTTTWVRMEISLISQSGEVLSPILVTEISNDFLAFLHASTIAQIKGPSGLMNLREDLLERARIRSDGSVTNILISSLVIEQ